MANPERVAILKGKGVKAWNKWRKENPDVRPDLRDADLSGADLIRVNFSDANLTGANLTGVDLSDANLIEANLSDTTLIGADFRL